MSPMQVFVIQIESLSVLGLVLSSLETIFRTLEATKCCQLTERQALEAAELDMVAEEVEGAEVPQRKRLRSIDMRASSSAFL